MIFATYCWEGSSQPKDRSHSSRNSSMTLQRRRQKTCKLYCWMQASAFHTILISPSFLSDTMQAHRWWKWIFLKQSEWLRKYFMAQHWKVLSNIYIFKHTSYLQCSKGVWGTFFENQKNPRTPKSQTYILQMSKIVTSLSVFRQTATEVIKYVV